VQPIAPGTADLSPLVRNPEDVEPPAAIATLYETLFAVASR
jgi:hypothetical protein